MFRFWSWPHDHAVTGQISIIQVASALIFHSGIFAGEKAQVTYQTDLLRVRVSIHKASHILGLVLRDEAFSEEQKNNTEHTKCAFTLFPPPYMWIRTFYSCWLFVAPCSLQTQSCCNLQCLHLCTCSVKCFTFKRLDYIISALCGSAAHLQLCGSWFQLTSPAQDDGSCVWDNLASFLHSGRMLLCPSSYVSEVKMSRANSCINVDEMLTKGRGMKN